MSRPTPEETVSSPQPPAPRERQRELLHGIGRDLAAVTPDGWYRIDMKATLVIDIDHLSLTVLMRDSTTPPVDPPRTLGPALRELRALMYEEGRGTWFSLRYTLDPPLEHHCVFNYDFDPNWQPDITATDWARDLDAFPRDESHVPAWLGAKLHEQPGDER